MTPGARPFLHGPDRIEHCEPLGRPIRMGSVEDLGVADQDRIQQVIASADPEQAESYISSLHTLISGMNSTFLEWCIALPHYAATRVEPDAIRTVLETALRRYREAITHEEFAGVDAGANLYDLLSGVDEHSIASYRSATAQGGASSDFLTAPDEAMADLRASIAAERWPDAARLFDRYYEQMRSRHDLAGEFVSAYVDALENVAGQDVAAEVMQVSLESCALLQGYWELITSVEPEVLTLLLAEHLRAHFSGPGRRGAVPIVEEPDRYRLILSPCGTGGALRQRRPAKPFPSAAPATWGRAQQVPAYCAHCARNELTSIGRLGHPAFVTEFEPDAEQPCGWTVYKDPSAIPERYYARLGVPSG